MDINTSTQEASAKLGKAKRSKEQVMRILVVWLCSGAAGVIGFVASYSEYKGDGDSQARITEFESCLSDYVGAADIANYPKLFGVNLDNSTAFLSGERTQVDAESDPSAKRNRLLHAGRSLSYGNRDCAQKAIEAAVAEYNFKHRSGVFAGPWRDTVYAIGWKTTSPVLTKCLVIATASAACAWVVAWLLMVGMALTWWFLMDRLGDIAWALKGQPMTQSGHEPRVSAPSTALFTPHLNPREKELTGESERVKAEKPLNSNSSPDDLNVRAETAEPITAIGAGPQKPARSELRKKTEVSTAAKIYLVGFCLTGGLFGGLVGIVFGCLICNAWCERRVYSFAVERGSLEEFFSRIYLPALCSYVWRSFLTFSVIGGGFALLSGDDLDRAASRAGVAMVPWLFSWTFVPFVPLLVRRRLIREHPPISIS